jgi:GT2 family glycosyltransferase
MTQPFTAARARNAGAAQAAQGTAPEFFQFLDGDCALAPGWIAAATALLRERPDVAVVCGRRRERFPGASVYNRLMDAEWDTPVGEARACGGDALMRAGAFHAVGGFDPSLIAGEEPDLCLRLRLAGWRIWRLEDEMTAHDAAMTRFGQWWRRTRRSGFAYAEGAARHGHLPERYNVKETLRALTWGLVLPLAALGGALLVTPWALALLLAWPAQVVRLAARAGIGVRWSWVRACFLTLGKVPEALGVLEYLWRRLRGGPARLIEYK